ncbi:HEPN domain-containing protein [Pseudomonas sp. TNT2022 ID1044]|uniref:HEPN domain-containing protein n=1 Tax=Pseudomonas sp. TNT2022 ID1044 TaxID=2942636 RepID=UPI00235FC14C|nr:HEPN domain-containing protein [Pseudomonas sp. TNT2022 ID1044]MDD0998820.1 HEPN domain-containing protein [Pseudomonas sp. TNT2022 ID1044]
MTFFLVVKVLDDRSISETSTKNYGTVELRSYLSDTKIETDALEKSASECGLDFARLSICARLATIVECETHSEAVHISENRFLEVLDLKSTEFSVSTIKTSRIGLIKDLESGEITPIKGFGFQPSLTFVMSRGKTNSFDTTNFVLSLKSELSERYMRSLHWARNSKNETNPQIKIIFLWFSLEALLKASVTDNCVESYIRLFLGFPNGRQLELVSKTLISNLESHPRYKHWQKKLLEIVLKIRDFRNDSVHEGFRSVDFTKSELELFSSIMIYAVSRCQAGVMRGLLNNIDSLSEFKEYAPLLFENNENLINDTHNNIIYSLDHPISY